MSLWLPERPRRVLVSSILGLALLTAAPVHAGVNRWTPIGPNGGGVTALAFSANGRTVLAGTETLGVFRSADNGRTWMPASDGLSGQEVVDLAASPGAAGWVYAVTSSGIFRSDDAGLHWTAADAGLPSVNGKVNAFRVATEPTDPAAVWAVVGTAASGERALYRSTNRGDRWQYAGRGLEGAVHDVAAHPTTAGVVFAATDSGLFRSTDSGGHWSPSGLRGREVSRVVFDRVQPRHLYAVILEEGVQHTVIGEVFTSDDGGARWKEVRQELSLYGSFELAADPARRHGLADLHARFLPRAQDQERRPALARRPEERQRDGAGGEPAAARHRARGPTGLCGVTRPLPHGRRRLLVVAFRYRHHRPEGGQGPSRFFKAWSSLRPGGQLVEADGRGPALHALLSHASRS
jgi:hypothetical protein